MRSILRSAVVVVALVSLGLSEAGAQDRAPGTAPGIAGALERMATASPAEKQTYAIAAKQEMAELVAVVRKLLDGARRDNDVETVQCITDRLSAMVALQQVTGAAETQMIEAIGIGDDGRAGHEVRKVAVALEKSRQMGAEAHACAGKARVGDTDTVLTWDGGIGTDDDFRDDATDPWTDQPPEVSPFM